MQPEWSLSRLMIAMCVALLATTLPPWRAAVRAIERAETQELTDQVNMARIEAGLSVLDIDEELADVAATRSDDMAARHYFSHVTPDGQDVFGLMRERGLTFRTAGENLAFSSGQADLPLTSIMESFMQSPGHRDNFLNPAFTQIGIGIADASGAFYVTVVLRG